jgi:hypothetical protein
MPKIDKTRFDDIWKTETKDDERPNIHRQMAMRFWLLGLSFARSRLRWCDDRRNIINILSIEIDKIRKELRIRN